MPWRIEHNINEPFNSPDYPSGCVAVEIEGGYYIEYFHSTMVLGKKMSIRWNENPSGKSNVFAYQICKKGREYDYQGPRKSIKYYDF